MAFLELPHLDQIVGTLSELLPLVTRPVANTLADLETYRNRPLEELFPTPQRLPALAVRSRWTLPGLVAEDLIFPSLHVPLEPGFRERYDRDYRETHQVFARRVRPTGTRPALRLLYLHGYMQPETYVEELTLLTTMALLLKIEVIQIQHAYHGRRTPRSARLSGELFWTADLVRSVEALRQSVLDSRTLLALLLEEDDRPVGVAGISLGGSLAMALTCLEPRFFFSAPMIAHMDLTRMLADVPVLARMRRELRSFGWGIEEFGDFIRALGWYKLLPQVPTERILMLAASADRFFDPAVVEETWRQWGKPQIHWYPSSHMGFFLHAPDAIYRFSTFLAAMGERAQRLGSVATSSRRPEPAER